MNQIKPKRWLLIALIGAACIGPVPSLAAGITGQRAPPLGVEDWFNLAPGKETIEIADFEGKVVYLYCFQSWCPGCHQHGFPVLTWLIDHYKDSDDVAFLAVQTVFEGFGTNTLDAAKKTGDRYGLSSPVGHSGERNRRSTLMQHYRTGGTPWTILIDRTGTVRFNDFRIRRTDAVSQIDRLLAEEPRGKIETLPPKRGGQDLIGTVLPHLDFDRWLAESRPKEPKATLYRWWTDTCPYCAASLPAIDSLRRKYRSDGLEIVAVYHPKPPRQVGDSAIIEAAQRLEYRGTVAVDLDWSELERFYLSTGSRGATSASFLVDAAGVIRFVHPGPILFPSDDPRDTQEDRDFRLLERAIRSLLFEKQAANDPRSEQPSPLGH